MYCHRPLLAANAMNPAAPDAALTLCCSPLTIRHGLFTVAAVGALMTTFLLTLLLDGSLGRTGAATAGACGGAATGAAITCCVAACGIGRHACVPTIVSP